MGKYIVEGQARLQGELRVQGSKNAALPILAATLLTPHSVVHNCPNLSDIGAASNILEYLGCRCSLEEGTMTVDTAGCCRDDIPDNLMREMRSSIVFLGAIIARCARARISMPGGCELGPRPIDIHLSGLKKLGVSIRDDYGYLDCRAEHGLHGAKISLPFPSVGATENIMIAASVARGDTEIHNAAREPEIYALAAFLCACGGKVQIDSSGTVYVSGVERLQSCEHTVIPDRIVAATWLSCAAITGSRLHLYDVEPQHLTACIPMFEEAGCELRAGESTLDIVSPRRLLPLRMVRTMPYPGFPTDAQAPFMAMCALSSGTSVFVENIFENRYKHAGELCRMGANIKVEGRVAVVQGVPLLHGAKVECTDLRGGASLVVAALAAQGDSEISEIRHVERGYEDLEGNLRSLGAKIKKVEKSGDIC